MIRRPSDPVQLYAVWQAWLADPSQPHPGTEWPECGFYRARRFREGYGWHWSPVAIWMESPTDPETGELVADEYLLAKVREALITDKWDICDLWMKVKEPVTEEAYRHAVAYDTWSDDKREKTAPAPKALIDTTTQPPLF